MFTPSAVLTPQRVLMLQSMRLYPSVSILMNTPGRDMDTTTKARLRSMVKQACGRLRSEGIDAEDIEARLEDHVELLAVSPLQTSVALFANAHHDDHVILSIEVNERVVVDPTFATRDLVRALHRTPRHLVLVLSAKEAKLYDAVGGSLVRAPGARFPRTAEGEGTRSLSAAAFLAEVDAALGAYLRVRAAPIVLVGAEPTLSQFRHTSSNLARLVGTVRGNHLRTPLHDLADLTAPLLEGYFRSREQEALDLLEKRSGQDRAVYGIGAVWLAARWEPVEMLAVEVGYFFPARVDPDGDVLTPATDVEHPDVIDDAVDEVVETVLERGGWVALVESGRIPDDARIALTVRRRD